MTVCTFFQQGRCRFGDKCKFEHPGRATAGPSGNRFGALSGFSGTSSPNQSQSKKYADDFGVNASDIKLDLTAGKNRPLWIFSSYSPQQHVPRQLFGGPGREQSPEELRARHYELAAAGNIDQAVQESQAMWAESMKQMDVALGDLNGAVKFIIDGKNEHPNRLDIVEGKTGPNANLAPGALGNAPSAFGQPSIVGQSSGFGQPSTLGQSSGFGQPSTLGQSSGFGQPSTLGQSSGFGQSSTLGQSSGFGQPSALGQSSGFGQPSALGQSSGFGQPSTLGQSTGFGQSSTLGQSSGFGQPSNLGGSGFGQPSTLGGQSGFGKPGFGQPAAPAAPASNPFGAPATSSSPFSQISNNQAAPGGFGQPAPTNAPSPFAQTASQQPAAPASGGFGQPQPTSGFPPSQPAASNPFGVPSQPAASNPFGTPSQPAASPFNQPAVPQGVPVQHADAGPRAFLKLDDPSQLNPLPELQGETRHDPSSKRLTMWKGRPVKYVNDHPCYLHPQDNSTLVRVNFPNGPPDSASLRDSQAKPEEYTPEVAAAYDFFLNNGYFKDSIPSVAPKREWISFDF
ncbi:hypothetical protein PENANT_c024G04822 [Penicillium antarcticum]|uniref:C3H1-type domain-containing protein n=1 Tax=Penicillium antarcticum TaxID=416450 RepID=A0A1V6PYB6_9EURO|nr:uncharacterized protein N7508_005159 [Penicillium antarcticum]KAJ5306144.1 hypothetical protein N7508_005159 [Penicillium antarcticum]OQD81955.1 hypothetical protein PENANT_c024G04822 [Penicillium antarcticum]